MKVRELIIRHECNYAYYEHESQITAKTIKPCVIKQNPKKQLWATSEINLTGSVSRKTSWKPVSGKIIK